jgi:hypothetical protein
MRIKDRFYKTNNSGLPMAKTKTDLAGPTSAFDRTEITSGVLTLMCAALIIAMAVYSAVVL